MFSVSTSYLKTIQKLGSFSKICRRCLLSSSYSCSDTWKLRLQTPILQKISAAEFAVKINEKFDKNELPSAVDVDILANKLEEVGEDQLDYMQAIFAKFYRTREYLKLTEATPHATIRALVQIGDIERLVTILQEKRKYGIFLDEYTANLLLDYFIENKLYKEAAVVAYEQMFQEDFSHPLTKALCWYACHLQWKDFTPDSICYEAPDDNEEDTFVRVNYIDNPYYDDHFDLPTEAMKLGKTFTMLASGLDNVVGRSYRLIGLGLHQKFDKGLELLQVVLDSEGATVSTDAVQSFMTSLESTESREPPSEEIEKGLARIEHLYPYITQQQKEELVAKLKELHENLVIAQKVVDHDLETELVNNVKQAVNEHETSLIENQKKTYSEWLEVRERLVAEQIEQLRIQRKKEELAERLLQLQAREERLQYFEQQDQIARGVKGYERTKALDKKKELDEQFVDMQ